MNAEPTPDDQAILLLCSRLGVPTTRDAAGADPYSLAEWNALARRLVVAGLRPGDLLERDVEAIAEGARLTTSEADRLARLLQRGGQLAIELERLAGLGIRVVTRASAHYPGRLRSKLRDAAPPILYCSGDLAIAEVPALAVVGSRDVDAAGAEFAERLAGWAAREGIAVVSGAARGVDVVAMRGALESGGTVVGFPADSLERAIRSVESRRAIEEGRMVLLTPFHPRAGFSIGNAMARNRLIYCQADWAVVVAAEVGKGGTWAGATECLSAGWTPVLVRSGDSAPAGNLELARRGARPFPMESVSIVAIPPTEAASTEDGEARRPLVELLAEASADLPTPAAEAPWSAEWERFLEVARDEAEIARRFGLPRAQVKARLRELVDSGRVRKTTRPAVRYQTVPMKL